MTAPDRLYDKQELADWLGVPVGWVRDAIARRVIPITWVGRHARFSPEDRAEIVAAGHENPTPATGGRAVRAARTPGAPPGRRRLGRLVPAAPREEIRVMTHPPSNPPSEPTPAPTQPRPGPAGPGRIARASGPAPMPTPQPSPGPKPPPGPPPNPGFA